MKVLVTGAGGMLAQAVIPALEEAGHAVLGLERADADVSVPGSLAHSIQVFQPEWIFNLAAFTRVDDCEAEVDRAYAVNALGARNLAQAAAGCGAALLTLSTDYVFDGNGTRPYREYDGAAPLSVYGASKWAGEQAVHELHARHVIVRTAWLFGRGGTHFIDTILRRARAGEPLRVVDDQRGSPTWTRDLAGALLRLAECGQYGTFHCTSSGECTWYDLAEHVLKSAGVRTTLERTGSASYVRPARRPAYSVLSNHLFEQVTGSRMPHWQDAVHRFLKHAGSRSGAPAAPGEEVT